MSVAITDSSLERAPARSARVKNVVGFVGYLALQAYCVAGLVTSRYPDSVYWGQLSFTGSDKMLPTVPLVYTVFRSDALRVAFQVLLAALAWWALAAVASSFVGDRRVAWGVRSVLLALGVVSPVMEWNSVILGESITISLTALLVAAWLRFARSPGFSNAALALCGTVVWEFARQENVVYVVAMAALAVAWAALRRRRLAVAIAVVLCVTAALGVKVVGRNPKGSVAVQNTADTIEDRILPNPGWTSWFIAHGMPYDQRVANATGLGDYGVALLSDPPFRTWLLDHGTRAYAEFLLTHPVYTLVDPLPSFVGEQQSLHYEVASPYPDTQPEPTVAMLSPEADWGRHRQLLPTLVEELLFQRGQAGDVLALVAGSVAAAIAAWRRHGRDRRLLIAGLLVASAIPQGYVIWITGGVGELDRLSMVVAVTVRIGGWLLLAFALDRLLTERATSLPSAVEARADGRTGWRHLERSTTA